MIQVPRGLLGWFTSIAVLVGSNSSLAFEPRPRQTADTLPKTATSCVGRIADRCKKCPSYAERVEQLKVHCKRPDTLVRVRAERCVGAYRSLSEHSPLGGSDEYFDASGQLIAAQMTIDTLGFCNGSSASRTFGTIPTCTTRFVT
ncbi:MAG TPA: hypothetical protein VI589_06310, partial [Vicinamibacteria bacterium]